MIRGVLQIIWWSIDRLGQERAPEAAAGMAFFTVFSLFPLLMLVVAVAGTLLQSEYTQTRILDTLLRFIPISRELIRQNMVQILEVRATVGVVGALGLLWSATSVFTILTHNLNRAWPDAPAKNILRARLTALAEVAALVLLLTLFLLTQTADRLLEGWRFPQGAEFVANLRAVIPSDLVLGIFMGLTLLLLYYWIPDCRVRWWEAVVGASVAALLFHCITTGFTYYVSSGVARYNIVYGSLGALLALMTWAYLVSLVILFGAHLSAALAKHFRILTEK